MNIRVQEIKTERLGHAVAFSAGRVLIVFDEGDMDDRYPRELRLADRVNKLPNRKTHWVFG